MKYDSIELLRSHKFQCLPEIYEPRYQTITWTMMVQKKYIFQKDNCPCHVSKSKLQFSRDIQLDNFDWPSRSPDLNTMLKLREMMPDALYQKQLQYNILDEFWRAMGEAVIEIKMNRIEFIENLYKSIFKQLMDVITSKEKLTKY